jgi:hypothetical protein
MTARFRSPAYGATGELALSALDAPPSTEVILAGRDQVRLAEAGRTVPHQIRTGMPPAPLAATPARLGAATVAVLRGGKSAVWIPAPLAGLSMALWLVARPAWRRVSR